MIDLNFSNDLPPAPTGTTNVRWQMDSAGNISANVVNSGVTGVFTFEVNGTPIGAVAVGFEINDVALS